jgi:hypothetical protein
MTRGPSPPLRGEIGLCWVRKSSGSRAHVSARFRIQKRTRVNLCPPCPDVFRRRIRGGPPRVSDPSRTPPRRPQVLVECGHTSASALEACLVRVGRLIPFPRMADLGAAAGRGGDDAMDAAAGPPTAAEVEAAPVPDGNQPRDTACASFPFPIGVFCVCLFSFWGFADARCFS